MNLFELCGKQLRIGKAISPPFELGGKKVHYHFLEQK